MRTPARAPGATMPISASASSCSEVPIATKKTTSTGSAPRWIADLQRIALRRRRCSEITMPAASAASSGSNRCVAPTWLEQRAHAEQHQRDSRGRRSAGRARTARRPGPERDRAADLPGETREHVDVVAAAAPKRRARRTASTARTARARRGPRARRWRARARSSGRARRFRQSPPRSSSARS